MACLQLGCISNVDLQFCANFLSTNGLGHFSARVKGRKASLPSKMCLCCLLAVFVNRQPPCSHTNSRHVLLHPRMHRNNL